MKKAPPPPLFLFCKISESLTVAKFNVVRDCGRFVKSSCFVFQKSWLQISPGKRPLLLRFFVIFYNMLPQISGRFLVRLKALLPSNLVSHFRRRQPPILYFYALIIL